MAVPLDDFDVILGNDFLHMGSIALMPFLRGLFVMNKSHPCFVPAANTISGKESTKLSHLSALQVKDGLRKGEPTFLATLVETKACKAANVPDMVVEVLEGFNDVMPAELPKELPPQRNGPEGVGGAQKTVARAVGGGIHSAIQGPIWRTSLVRILPIRTSKIMALGRHGGGRLLEPLPLFLKHSSTTGLSEALRETHKGLAEDTPHVPCSNRAGGSQRLSQSSIAPQMKTHSTDRSSSSDGCLGVSFFFNASCRTCHNPKILFESVLNQLKFQEKMVPKESEGQDHKSMVYLIFDNLELVRDWEKHSVIISMLFKLYDILKLPEVGLIFISNASPDTYYTNTGSLEPLPIYFPDYTEDELYQIFSRNQENPKLYSSFLDITLKPFCRITRRVDELSIAFQSLFQKYCEPLSDSRIVPTGDMKRMLFKDLNRHLAPSLNETFSIPSHLSYQEEAKKDKVRWKANVKNSGHGEALDDINFHMSVSAKYLLISAFLASRNRATLDAALFDSTGGGDNRKRKRKISEASKEKKETAEEELLMKGPGTFPLERLLAIFQCITSVMEDSLDEGVQESGSDLGAEGGNSELMSDVLLQLSTLCNANFISKGGTCPLEASTRYRSTVSEELALKVARSMKFPLSQYLYQK
ncbi:hypothetical protein Syun_006028 [Stephania yunnanensis]|uniref:Origin recognition complex subunit 5 n=1 Tax=Stephania yunnanensis TaxID=152371 RepID=A0AAP0KVV3_9MAGN